MDLTDASVPASTQYLGNGTVIISSKKRLRIKAANDEILVAEVPEDKSWEVKIHLEIIETDA